MRVAIEDENNNIAFYKFNGRYKNKFIEKAKKDVKGLTKIWQYDYVKDNSFINQKTIYNK